MRTQKSWQYVLYEQHNAVPQQHGAIKRILYLRRWLQKGPVFNACNLMF